jgi:tryptophan synthase alpha chain
MNKINALFREKQRDVISVYFTAGHPRVDDTPATIRALAARGIDMIEIGIPFSDPLADGPVIQQSSAIALRQGMTLARLLACLRDTRDDTLPPLLLMGYLNPILCHGFERFCQDCRHAGVSGMIIPDLPFREYFLHYKPVADRYDLRVIMLVTPETSDERLRLIDAHTDGFIYAVSSASTTGARERFDDATLDYFRRLSAARTRNPLLIGFGISNRVTLDAALAHASGAIIGSQFVSLLAGHDSPDAAARALATLLALPAPAGS